ncbi:MAG TPA: hypothetical protein VMC09_13290 [Anaerolineales bacterium]|nr:hypothetical protein [Anaerolineales bacterium]
MSFKRNPGTLIAGSILIVFGLLALFGQLFRGFDLWSYLWPFFVIGFGGLFFLGMFLGGKNYAGLAIPGSIFSVIGLMLLFQRLTGMWESWAYGWTVILVAVGLGLFIMGTWTGNEHRRRAGLKVMQVGAILFVIFGGFFELILNAFRPYGVQQYIFPALLVLVGIYLVVVRSGLLPSSRSNSGDGPINLSDDKK